MTLDCHLHLSDELEVPDGQLWRHMDQGLESSGICAFPYGILEIKLQVSARVPSLSLLSLDLEFESGCGTRRQRSITTFGVPVLKQEGRTSTKGVSSVCQTYQCHMPVCESGCV